MKKDINNLLWADIKDSAEQINTIYAHIRRVKSRLLLTCPRCKVDRQVSSYIYVERLYYSDEPYSEGTYTSKEYDAYCTGCFKIGHSSDYLKHNKEEIWKLIQYNHLSDYDINIKTRDSVSLPESYFRTRAYFVFGSKYLKEKAEEVIKANLDNNKKKK